MINLAMKYNISVLGISAKIKGGFNLCYEPYGEEV
jgi:hypothetical protein